MRSAVEVSRSTNVSPGVITSAPLFEDQQDRCPIQIQLQVFIPD